MKSNIQLFKDSMGVSYRDIRKATGIPFQTIRNAIVDIASSKMGTLCKFADYFGCCVSDLFTDGCNADFEETGDSADFEEPDFKTTSEKHLQEPTPNPESTP